MCATGGGPAGKEASERAGSESYGAAAPPAGPERHIIFGDLGASHGFSLCSACTAGTTNCEAEACAANRSAGLVSEVVTADMFLHVGDFAYDFDGDAGRVGDQFMRNIEQLAAYVPYMVSHGNNEDGPTPYEFNRWAHTR